MVAVVNKVGLAMPDAAVATPVAGSDSADALAAGKNAGAEMVVFGSYQIVGDQIRVTGQMTDVSTGSVVSSLQTTGTVTGIFRVEDKLALQMNPAMARERVRYGKSQPNKPLMLFGVQTDIYAESNAVVRPLPSGRIQPQFYTGPGGDYNSDYSYFYEPGTVS